MAKLPCRVSADRAKMWASHGGETASKAEQVATASMAGHKPIKRRKNDGLSEAAGRHVKRMTMQTVPNKSVFT